ncbi:hypothetical protein [Victivallis sp. Marseille-Q1083]|uniref:hypothetical protein n=1 Tax=Victivallis sp. Marseille-Q1083 TaxID=2717288 RepID=UPI00158C2EA4|nr:hypothetical protein [Victivallis sp. Marseille-Q1083]
MNKVNRIICIILGLGIVYFIGTFFLTCHRAQEKEIRPHRFVRAAVILKNILVRIKIDKINNEYEFALLFFKECNYYQFDNYFVNQNFYLWCNADKSKNKLAIIYPDPIDENSLCGITFGGEFVTKVSQDMFEDFFAIIKDD